MMLSRSCHIARRPGGGVSWNLSGCSCCTREVPRNFQLRLGWGSTFPDRVLFGGTGLNRDRWQPRPKNLHPDLCYETGLPILGLGGPSHNHWYFNPLPLKLLQCTLHGSACEEATGNWSYSRIACYRCISVQPRNMKDRLQWVLILSVIFFLGFSISHAFLFLPGHLMALF